VATPSADDWPVITEFQREGERWRCLADGKPLSGIMLVPEGAGPFPGILISHGLGGSAASFGLNKAREFVKWGFACIAVDYTHVGRGMGPRRPPAGKDSADRGGPPRGGASGDAPPRSGQAPGAPRRGTQHPPDYGGSPENVRRALAAIEILQKYGNADPKRIAAYGHSMGGFATIALAAHRQDILAAAAITGSGVAPRAGFPAPPLEAASKIRTPFLMMHGSVDRAVRPGQSEDLKRALDASGVPNKRHVFEGADHPIDQTNREEVFTMLRAWFTERGVLPE
jgi:dienelactone hydrolase